MLDCHRVREELVFRYEDREMESELLIAYREHVSRCHHCSAESRHVRQFLAVLKECAGRRSAPERLRARIAAAIALLTLFGLICAHPQAALAAGDRLALPGLQGGQLSEAELESGTTILIVWASWSPRCRDIVPRVNQLAETWSSKARVRTVVFQEKAPAVERFLSGKGMKVPVFLDSDGIFSKKHAVTTLPGLLIFKNGEVAFRGELPVNNPDALIRRQIG